ncbi:MAG: 5 10-methylenetetrahydrofolate reductase [Candidatus Saganbacteria bacterium]|uniref:Methylenetetrahydrofolate reductase n=1 Tax=Candidatus Saganbacteria bacterium TaxID=2575572 RepID=A0A833NWU6_UNCSA|nr:MAG: 5 10-methylenetetrahydrofolate reductase [Candidatus Saganbacteria bacterium]
MNFSEALKSGKFLITAELSPPKGVEVEPIIQAASVFKSKVDAVNVTDNQRARLHLSSLAFCRLLHEQGFEPILQMTCRDRNALALQSDILGAYALGLRNILALSGDYPKGGSVRPVYDLDSVQLISTIKKMENEGIDLFGEKLAGKMNFFVGGAINPGAEPVEQQILKTEKKIEAGVDFFQTQVIYGIELFKRFFTKLNNRKAKVIAGIFPLKSYNMAVFLNEKVPGVFVPEEILKRMKESRTPETEGIKISIEIINELKPVCSGIHIMTLNNDVDIIAEILNKI